MVARIIVAALVALPVSKADSDAIAELFDVLDRDQDGLVMVGEISEAQRPYFERTLRVSDANRDGALSRSELGGALTDPAPRRSAGGPRGGRPRRVFDPERLDKNKDGQITIDEVPFPTRDRFRNALSQTGRDAIPVEAMAGLLRRNRPDELQRPTQGQWQRWESTIRQTQVQRIRRRSERKPA